MRVMAFVSMLTFNLTIIVGAVYLVDQRHWSAWTIVGAAFLLRYYTPEGL